MNLAIDFGSILKGQNMGKSCITDMQALDVRKMQRDGLLQAGRSLSWSWSRNGVARGSISVRTEFDSVTLDYRQRDHSGEWRDMNYPVRLTWTPCHYGGRRAWWLCPAAGCGRRVAVLYGGGVFACRHCHQLSYKSQNDTPSSAAYRRADNLRDRLGWMPGVIHGIGNKPKGMHWQTFLRMLAIYNGHDRQTLAGMTAAIGQINRKLGRIKL